MRAAASPRWDRCGFVISSQNGKTQTAINIALCRIDQEPTKVLYIGPTRDNVSTVISPKVDQAIRLSPAMDAKAHYGQSWTKTLMPIAGVSFRLAWAGSPIQIAADDACIVLIDEVDRTDRDIRGEGSIIELGDGRHGSYIDGKTIVFSTPTEGFVTTEVDDRTGLEHWARAEPDALNSQMWEFWQDGTRHEYAIPCSACRTYFIPRLSRLFIPEGATPIQARKEARLCCPICEHGMTSEEVFEWGRKGVYLAPGQRAFLEDGDDVKAVLVEDMTVKPSLLEDVEFGDYMAPAVEETSDATFWCSGLISYSRKNSIARLAEAITKARRTTDPNRIKTVTNTKFAEPYAPPGERREWRTVHNCRAEYRLGDFPQEVGNRIAVATMGVDVQKLFLTWVVRLWTEGNNSWLLARGELNGETDQPEVWRALGQLLRRTYGGVPIYRACVDSGYRKSAVYQFQRSFPDQVIATRGRKTASRPFWATRVDVDVDGTTIQDGLETWWFDTDMHKMWVHSRFSLPPGETGQWRLPYDIDEAYCREVTGEYRNDRGEWHKTGRNHMFDAEVLAYLAIRTLGGDEGTLSADVSSPAPLAGDAPAGDDWGDDFEELDPGVSI